MQNKMATAAKRREGKKRFPQAVASPLKIALTGNIGTGKSTVAGMFAELDVPVFDADRVGHDLLYSNANVQKKVIEAFGKEIIFAGSIDRRKLGKIVFNDPRKKKRLESILHPEIMNNIIENIPQHSGSRYVVVEIPLLYEAKLSKQFDHVVLVKAKPKVAVERASRSLGMTKEDVIKRLNTQIDQSKKEKLADFVIANDGSLDELRSRVALVHIILSSLAGRAWDS